MSVEQIEVNGVFISYRREDSAGYAGRVYDRLEERYGRERVFMDVEGIDPGTDFVESIDRAVASCRALVVLIGPKWTDACGPDGKRRIEDPHDFVRLETAAALKRGIRVLPVLVDGAAMPGIDRLPDDLAALVRRQAIELNHKQWDASVGELLRALDKIMEVGPSEAPGNARKPRRLWPLVGGLVGVIALALAWWVFQGEPESSGEAALVRMAPEAAQADQASTPEPEPEAEPVTDSRGEPDSLAVTRPESTDASPAADDEVPPKSSPPPRDDDAGATRRSTPAVAPVTSPPAATAARTPAAQTPARAAPVTPPAPAVVARIAPPAEMTPAETTHTLRQGDSWTYRVTGAWATSRQREIEFAFEAVRDRMLRESARSGEGASMTLGWPIELPMILQRPGIGPEFSPYLGNHSELRGGVAWKGIPTPPLDGQWGQWNTIGKVLGQERVSVPAGSFDAWKVEVWSNRHPTEGLTFAASEPVRIHYLVWYAPDEKRYVKMVRTITSAAGRTMERDTFELVARGR